MSSLQENSTVPLDVVNKRKQPFQRNDSFDKFQYTAFYTLQLAGTLLSQKSLLQILDELQFKSRIILEKHAVNTLWPALKMIYGTILFWFDALIRYTIINVIFDKQSTIAEPEKTYALRVQKLKETNIMKTTLTTESDVTDTLNDEKRIKLTAEFDSNSIRHNSSIRSWKSTDSDSEMGSNNSISPRQNVGMVVIVYGSATLVYIQLMFLAAFLQTSVIPPGLVFLVLSLAYISYIVFSMGLSKAKSKDEIPSTKKDRSAPSTSSTTDTVSELPKKINGRLERLGRSTTRRFLYFHNKTLSKIKLL